MQKCRCHADLRVLSSLIDELSNRVSASIDEAALWLRANRLQLNHSKTELLWCTSQRRQHLLPTAEFHVGQLSVLPVRSVRDLGINIDADLSMQTHVLSTVRACFAALRQIRSIRRSLPRHALLSLVHALVVSKVDYCNSVLAGVTGNLLYRLQSVLNAAARLVFSALVEGSGEDPVPAMRTGLPVPAQHRAVIPLRVAPTADDVDGRRRRLRSASSMTLIVPSRNTSFDARRPCVPSRSRTYGPGRTPCHWTSKPHRR